MKRVSQCMSGFSLVEVLAAAAILTSVVLGVIALLPTSYVQITNAGRSSTLNHLAQQKLDYLRIAGYGSNDLLAGTHPSTALGDASDVAERPADLPSDYSISWLVNDDTPMAGVKEVSVTVGFQLWDESDNPIAPDKTANQKTVTFTTYISEP